MAIIILDGVEKAGKTSLSRALVSLLIKQKAREIVFNHFSGSEPVTITRMLKLNEYRDSLKDWIIWDRSWASGSVYPALGFSQKEEAIAGEGEKIWREDQLGKSGIRFMMLGPSAKVLRERREEDDLPVDPEIERDAFRAYGVAYGWTLLTHPEPWREEYAEGILELVRDQIELRELLKGWV